LVFDEAELQDQYILDTEAGMLRRTVFNGERLSNNDSREVECNLETTTLICYVESPSFERFIIEPEMGFIPFAFIRVQTFPEATVLATVGTCTKA
jgi:hypothetical protein